MKFAEIVIKPISSFGTPLKGNIVFGHFCWQLAYDNSLIKGNFSEWIKSYPESPFIVFSSAFIREKAKDGTKWLVKRPTIPLTFFQENGKDCLERLKRRKELKKKKWIRIGNFKIELDEIEFTSGPFYKEAEVPHNFINRLLFSTSEDFSPYNTLDTWFNTEVELSIFTLFDEMALDIDLIKKAFTRIGLMGYGRDATWGKGKFEVLDIIEHPLPEPSEYLYMLSPFVPKKGEFLNLWFQPVVHFGKHGGPLALSTHPFKEPVLMVEEGAVGKVKEIKGPLVGKAILNVSKVFSETVVQGYSIGIPFSFGGGK